jgi:hypothetical protein
MSLIGISNPLLGALAPLNRAGEANRVPPDRAGSPGGLPAPASGGAPPLARSAVKPGAPLGTPAAAQGAVPAEPPPGTDPELWSVLTTEERQFFAKSSALGPLTYGRIKAATQPAPPAARGVRLDVRA